MLYSYYKISMFPTRELKGSRSKKQEIYTLNSIFPEICIIYIIPNLPLHIYFYIHLYVGYIKHILKKLFFTLHCESFYVNKF